MNPHGVWPGLPPVEHHWSEDERRAHRDKADDYGPSPVRVVREVALPTEYECWKCRRPIKTGQLVHGREGWWQHAACWVMDPSL